MNIVMPMAGRGNRFVEAGFTVPKPLIDVRGRPMYSRATESLPLELAERLIFICLKEHLDNFQLAEDICRRYGRWKIELIALDEITAGQACTVLKAEPLIDNDRPLLIYNADTYCRTSLGKRLLSLPDDVAGLLGVFRAPGDKWSFARTDDSGRVVETAEKRRISNWASTGLYWFRRGAEFVRHAQAMIAANDRTNGEFYVAPIYNRLIAAGAHIEIDPVDEVWALGTPEDLRNFEANYPR